MKNCLLICFICVIAGQNCQSQWIQQIWTNPATITTNTPIQLMVDVDFPSGDCIDKTLNMMQLGN